MPKLSKTFCPLPWMHFSVQPEGMGRLCCEGFELVEEHGRPVVLNEVKDLRSYYNSDYYKKTRLQMLNGERPSHCKHCFNQEDHGVNSMREKHIGHYFSDIKRLVANTNEDGSIDNPEILYMDMAMGNKCNLKCRMCTPWSSYPISKDWIKLGKKFDKESAKRIYSNKWYISPNYISFLKEALPSLREIFMVGGEPMLIDEHMDILEMIIKEGHAGHIILRYNSNYTIVPDRILNIWKNFKRIEFNCSIESDRELNDYIRYPSRWEALEKNLYLLDEISFKNKHIHVYIHTTLQAYNVIKIPRFLNYLRDAKFKKIHRVPFFIWVKVPEWLSPAIYPQKFREEISDNIIKSVQEHEDFFLNYNDEHRYWSILRLKQLREFAEMIRMIRTVTTDEKYLNDFVKETRGLDRLRNQSITQVLPEVGQFFS